jgi:hypothetical protein
MDLTASSAVNLPMSSARSRLVVIWMGVTSIRSTYSGVRVPPRFTFTTNLVMFMCLFVTAPIVLRRNDHGNANEAAAHSSIAPLTALRR